MGVGCSDHLNHHHLLFFPTEEQSKKLVEGGMITVLLTTRHLYRIQSWGNSKANKKKKERKKEKMPHKKTQTIKSERSCAFGSEGLHSHSH